MNRYEQSLVKRFKKAEEVYSRLSKECDEYFMPLAEEYIEQGDIKCAKEVVARCPCHITNVFILDAIREHIKATEGGNMKVYLVFDIIEGRHFKEVFTSRDDAYAYTLAEYKRIYCDPFDPVCHEERMGSFYEIEEREVK